MGWEAKSKGTRYKPWWAEREGLRDHSRMQLRVSSACGIKSCQRLGGKVMWAEEKMEMTWFLAVRIERSARFERWLKGGAYWKVRLAERKTEVRSDEVSLSRRMCVRG